MNCPNCGIDIREHPANRCMDSWIAEKVMGLVPCDAWDLFHWSISGGEYIHHPEMCKCDNKCYPTKACPGYSTDISAAWEVAEKMKLSILPLETGYFAGIYDIENEYFDADMGIIDGHFGSGYAGMRDICATAPTPELAICRAALLAVMEEE